MEIEIERDRNRERERGKGSGKRVEMGEEGGGREGGEFPSSHSVSGKIWFADSSLFFLRRSGASEKKRKMGRGKRREK